jgi:ArsR family transcriptional regulator
MKHDVYSIFGNKVRTKLLLCLSHGEKNVTELIQNCKLSQSAVSQHLGKLRSSGIVRSEKLGKEVVYSIQYKKATEVAKLLMDLEKEIV